MLALMFKGYITFMNGGTWFPADGLFVADREVNPYFCNQSEEAFHDV